MEAQEETKLDPEAVEIKVVGDGPGPDQKTAQASGLIRANTVTIKMDKSSRYDFGQSLIRAEDEVVPYSSPEGTGMVPNPLRRFIAVFPQRDDGVVEVHYFNLDHVNQMTFRGE